MRRSRVQGNRFPPIRAIATCGDPHDVHSLQTNAPFEQMMLVFDLDNITSAHYSCKTFAASFVTLLMLFQENYPLVLNKILVIRAPAMARHAFNMLTPFLSDSVQQMIDIPSGVTAVWVWETAGAGNSVSRPTIDREGETGLIDASGKASDAL